MECLRAPVSGKGRRHSAAPRAFLGTRSSVDRCQVWQLVPGSSTQTFELWGTSPVWTVTSSSEGGGMTNPAGMRAILSERGNFICSDRHLVNDNNVTYPRNAINKQYCRPNKVFFVGRNDNSASDFSIQEAVCRRALQRSNRQRRTDRGRDVDLRKPALRRLGGSQPAVHGRAHRFRAPIWKESKSFFHATTQWHSGFRQRPFAQLRPVEWSAACSAKENHLLTETKESVPGASANRLNGFSS
ncbi:MAG: hypothetical protein QOC76_572 [Mycobacterium sp.]|nr:hypothetical protein [Mycobacterium sp.]